ncbi:MAG: S8 family serine peptidase [Anaerolineae bacterium]|nr:S8 family serine peptidase [Anaerolineae bacterium]
MKRHRWFTYGALICLIVTLAAFAPHPVAGQPPDRVPVLIGFRGRPGPAEADLVRRHGGQVKYRYHLVNAIAAALPETAVARLEALPQVTRIEPDLPMHALDIELDNAWGVTRIGAGTVHQQLFNRGSGVGIAIIDSGINYDHPDLDDNYAGGVNVLDLGAEPWDVYGHGTHVAGTACAEDNDNGVATGPLGVVGVAPACDLYAVRVLDDNGFGMASDLIYALQWTVEHQIPIANLSLGWDRDPGELVAAAFDNAYAAGLVIVAAACNNGNPPGRGENVCWPGKYPSVIAVAATDGDDQRAGFSSTGTEVELAAPGAAVYSTWNDDTGYADPQPVCGTDENEEYGCYKYGSGTSMASPHVAGLAALIIAAGAGDANGDGCVSNLEVRQRLIDTAEDLGTPGWDAHFGYGLVDALASVETVTPPEPFTDLAVTNIAAPTTVTVGDVVSVEVTVTNAGTEDVAAGAATVTLAAGEAIIGIQPLDALAAGAAATLTFGWDTTGVQAGNYTLVGSHSLVDDDATNDSATALISLLAPAADLSVAAIDPSAVWAGTTSATITGEGFQPGAQVTFEGGKGPAPTASNVAVVDSTIITLDITAKAPKMTIWDVRVTNPDGQAAVLPGGLTVFP